MESAPSRVFAKSSRTADNTYVSPRITNNNTTAIPSSNNNNSNNNNKRDDTTSTFSADKTNLYASVFAPNLATETRVQHSRAVFGRTADADNSTNGPSGSPELRDSSVQESNLDRNTKLGGFRIVGNTGDAMPTESINRYDRPKPMIMPSYRETYNDASVTASNLPL